MNFLFLLPGAFFAPVIHEFVKARVSAALGDPAPKKAGFITFNPFKFFEPIGFLMMLFFQVGWGQPVTTSPMYYRNKRKGVILTYTVPIVANLFVGMMTLFVLGILRAPLVSWAGGYGMSEWALMDLSFVPMKYLIADAINTLAPETPLVVQIVFGIVRSIYVFGIMNIGLALFNLIPVFPLAANRLLHLFVSPATSMRLNHYEKPMQIILFLLLVFGFHHNVIFPIRDIIAGLVMI